MSRQRAVPLPPKERRESIIATTIPLVARRGASVTTAEIADAAGIAEGTVFSVFDDKADLLRAVFAAALDPSGVVDSISKIDKDQPLKDQLIEATTILVERASGVAGIVDALRSLSPMDHSASGDHRMHIMHARATAIEARSAVHASLIGLLSGHTEDLRVRPDVAAAALTAQAWHAGHMMTADPPSVGEIVDLIVNGAINRGSAECC
jgi:AcrR family transcriptional regulator